MYIFALAAATLIGVLVLSEVVFRYRGTLDAPAFEDHPDYGYLMRPSQSVSPRGIRFRINSQGFRGADFEPTKPRDVTRIAFVGCSVTYGGGSVPDAALFANRVPGLLGASRGRKYESINISAPGWGIQNMASCLRTRGVYGSDLLVWVISCADFRRPKTTRTEYGFWTRRSPSRVVYGLGVVAFLLSRNSRYTKSRVLSAPRTPSQLLEDNLAALDRSLRETARTGLRHLLVVVPMAEQSSEHESDTHRFTDLARAHGVPFLSVKPVLDASSAGPFLDHVHLTVTGHELVAEALAAAC